MLLEPYLLQVFDSFLAKIVLKFCTSPFYLLLIHLKIDGWVAKNIESDLGLHCLQKPFYSNVVRICLWGIFVSLDIGSYSRTDFAEMFVTILDGYKKRQEKNVYKFELQPPKMTLMPCTYVEDPDQRKYFRYSGQSFSVHQYVLQFPVVLYVETKDLIRLRICRATMASVNRICDKDSLLILRFI